MDCTVTDVRFHWNYYSLWNRPNEAETAESTLNHSEPTRKPSWIKPNQPESARIKLNQANHVESSETTWNNPKQPESIQITYSRLFSVDSGWFWLIPVDSGCFRDNLTIWKKKNKTIPNQARIK